MAERRVYSGKALALREERHRRALLLGMAALLVLAMSPLLGHHLPIGIERALEGRDHILALCMVAVHALLGPVHLAFHLLLLAGFSHAVWDRVRALHSMRRALAGLAAAAPDHDGPVARAALAAGLRPDRVRVVAGLPNPAFTAGWIRPRVYVAEALSAVLSDAELHAVLAHEAAHVRRRDPLRLSALRFLSCTLFWMPALRRLGADIAAEREVQADDAAANEHGLALASALVRLAGWSGVRQTPAAIGFTDGDLLERRVRRLAGAGAPPRSSVTRRSLMGAAVALLLAWSSGLAVAHPLPTGHDEHCDRGGGALLHLFCTAPRAHAVGAHCPFRVGSH